MGTAVEPPRDGRHTVAIDLGKWVSGVAVFDAEGVLVRAREVTIRRWPRAAGHMAACLLIDVLLVPEGADVVFEKMRDYKGKAARSRDLAHLRDVAKALRGQVRAFGRGRVRVVEYTAHAWKGNVPKTVTEGRILRELTHDEARGIVPRTKETFDAIGIGLFHIGRLGRGMTRRE